MRKFGLNRFPKPALLYFLHIFGGADLADIRANSKAQLLELVASKPGILRQIQELARTQPIYADPLFLRAWRRAFWDLPACAIGCLKMRFYAMVVDKNGCIVAESANRRMTEEWGTGRFCDKNTCIRTNMASRTDAAVGDCGHAPLWCLSKLWGLGFAKQGLKYLKIYEAGFRVEDFAPWVSEDISYTCLQCQNEFTVFGLKRIFGVKYINGIAQWVELPTADSFYNTGAYALGDKKA